MCEEDSETPELTLLMPCLNEAETIGTCIERGTEALRKAHVSGEVLVADNGSSDGSQDIARSLGARVIDVPEKGYGSALISGIEAARGKYIIMADADGSYDWSDIGKFLAKLRNGYDLVMGSRLPRGGGTIKEGAMPWLHRWVGNPILSLVGRVFFNSPVTDFHCGMRGFSKSAIEKLQLQTKGMELASEMVIKAAIWELRVSEVPVTLSPDGRTRRPHLRTWRDGWRHLRFMLIYCPRWMFLVPGMLLIIAGCTGFVLLLPGPFRIGAVGLDVNTLLVASAACIVGFQCIIFWLFARIFAMTEGFLPVEPLLKALGTRIHLETGLLLSMFMIGLGVLLLTAGVAYWGRHGFGGIPYQTGLRIVIPAVTLLTLGTQALFSSFFLSMLGLHRRGTAHSS